MAETYQVLAVRHRPKIVDDIIGQELAVKTLRGFFKAGRVPQTILISGPYGSGKTTLARMIARYLNCMNPSKVDGYVYGTPCGKCASCSELAKPGEHNHPDVHEANAAESRGIDAVRGWIQQSKYKPKNNFRVFILDEVHAITGEAANAFLKPLEEPSKSTVWILCTTDPGRLLPTVRSRAVPVKVNAVSPEDCAELLSIVSTKEGFDVPNGNAAFLKIADAVHSHPRDALQVLESVINIYQTLDPSNLDLDKVVTDVAAEVVGETPEVAARKYLFGVYSGKYTTPLSIIQNVTNHQMFVDAVLRYHAQTMKFVCSKKLWDKFYLDFYKKLQDEGFHSKETISTHKGDKQPVLLQTGSLARITETFFEAISQLKQYSVDPYLILFRMTTKAILEWKDANGKYEAQAEPQSTLVPMTGESVNHAST